ncbi:hypothetical protein BBJ29_009537 [Phytophthora kernoviae]|uniref:HTH La-type RNA-binding domain-containing protein n=1 Tax=Phytophthora kernoviae TaxID=325452 RepID=A0A3F2RHZ4_9STRA|nr:hypothetical protein BBP00_00007566 [Phytophthora kernoviae]RLN69075.1 hypothetical protein BBJ29_009537 [Phytophthora kernoviae]
MSAQQDQAPALEGAQLKEAIKRQVEFYFSRANLANDAYLVSQMNSQMYVPVEVIINFSKIKLLTDNTALLVEAVHDSTVCSLNSTKDAIKPNIKSERTTIILREIPSSTEPADVEAIFEGCGDVASVRSDVGDTWFVTMNTESEAVNTLLALRSKKFNGAPIKARLKSENMLKSFYPTQPAENVIAPAVGAPYGGRGYYASPNMGYYDNYGVQYNTGNPRAGQPHNNYNGADNSRYGNNQRGGAAGGRGQGSRQNRSNGVNNAGSHQPKDIRAKSGSFEQRGAGSSRKGKDKRTSKTTTQQANGSNGSKRSTAAAASAERQPILNAANFPPLPATAENGEASNVITHKYAHEDIMEIVKNMDEKDCMVPEGKMDYAAHPAALTAEAHPDLLRNQRTYSIEQARDAMRQGRPIRSDSVGSIDYESMMYGEDYTKEARELRKQKAETAVPSDDAAPTPVSKSATSAKAVVGYAAAVINGTPVPAPEPKKKQPATKPAAKEAKKPIAAKKAAAKTPEGAAKAAAAPAADGSLPKAGAWGGRNFLDVVKSDPPAAPVKVDTPASNAKSTAPVSESK